MSLRPIPFEAFRVRAHHIWDIQRLLVTAGDFAAGHFNTMTVGWGSFGTMWGHPFAQVVIRPTRYTYEFMERYPTFTICAFPDAYEDAVDLLGSRSGRDGNKIAAAGLTPVASATVAAPAFAEADLIVECRKIYWDDFDSAHFVDPRIEDNYPRKDYHRIYYGRIVAISGDEQYSE
jgi:flavin reductase (DIM6/NTAB) family NADH-FMN oxidoreductase RutF